jgi:LysM repeat protein
MRKRSSAPARVLAVIALVCGVAGLLVVISTSLGGDDGDDPRRRGENRGAVENGGKTRNGKIRDAYVVQNGDTLTSIALKTGVPVARIEALNPGVDPQILISGEKLKLR